MRVLALTKYGRNGASSRLRFLQYEAALAAHGIELTVRPLFSDRYLDILYAQDRRSLLETAVAVGRRMIETAGTAAFDTVWLEGEVLPWLPAALEQFLLLGMKRLVVDYDDAISHRYGHLGTPLFRTLFGRKIEIIMGRADAVVVGNAHLAGHAMAAGARRIATIPTVIDLDRHPLPPARPTVDPPVVGWIGTPQTRKYLEAINPVLSRLHLTGRATVRIVGATATPGISPNFHFVPWGEASEVEAVQGFDIGIMPLPDDEWARGKSGFKLIQYMAGAKPIVASPVGANVDLIEPEATGLFATSPAEWEAALNRLIDDAALRHQMGQRGRQLVEAKYNIAATVSPLIAILGAEPES